MLILISFYLFRATEPVIHLHVCNSTWLRLYVPWWLSPRLLTIIGNSYVAAAQLVRFVCVKYLIVQTLYSSVLGQSRIVGDITGQLYPLITRILTTSVSDSVRASLYDCRYRTNAISASLSATPSASQSLSASTNGIVDTASCQSPRNLDESMNLRQELI